MVAFAPSAPAAPTGPEGKDWKNVKWEERTLKWEERTRQAHEKLLKKKLRRADTPSRDMADTAIAGGLNKGVRALAAVC